MLISELNFLTERQAGILLKKVSSNKKHRLLVLLMMDAGLRVTEAVSMKISNLRTREKIIRIKSLKKKAQTYRDIPMSSRLLGALADYIVEFGGNKYDENQYLFPSNGKHLTRESVWMFLHRIGTKEAELRRIHPHALRHTFATRVVGNGASLLTAKELLGHSSIRTTEIYTHIPAEILKRSIENLEKKEPRIKKIWNKIIGQKRPTVVRLGEEPKFMIGRDNTMMRVKELSEKNVNILIRGSQGVGKSHILENIDLSDKKVVRIDEMKSVKKMLLNFILYILNNDKKKVKELIFKDDDEMNARLQKDSIQNLTETLFKITEKKEYTLVIDDLGRITNAGVILLEKLKVHFHLICAARNIKVDKATFLTNFEILTLKNLNRQESLALVHRLSYDVMEVIESYDMFKNHIWEQTNGNPQFIYELVERFRAEQYISNDVVREIRHTAARSEIDMSQWVLVLLGSMMVLRYYGREIGEGGYQLIGGAALVFGFFARGMWQQTKRKFI